MADIRKTMKTLVGYLALAMALGSLVGCEGEPGFDRFRIQVLGLCMPRTRFWVLCGLIAGHLSRR